MPRLLSNKEPTKKITGVKEAEKKVLTKPSETKTEKKVLSKPSETKTVKTEDEMTAWEYYSFLMRFGKRKMTRFEWLTWVLKKDEEDRQKRYIRRKEGPFEGKISAAEFNWRISHDKDFDERLVEVDYNLK